MRINETRCKASVALALPDESELPPFVSECLIAMSNDDPWGQNVVRARSVV